MTRGPRGSQGPETTPGNSCPLCGGCPRAAGVCGNSVPWWLGRVSTSLALTLLQDAVCGTCRPWSQGRAALLPDKAGSPCSSRGLLAGQAQGAAEGHEGWSVANAGPRGVVNKQVPWPQGHTCNGRTTLRPGPTGAKQHTRLPCDGGTARAGSRTPGPDLRSVPPVWWRGGRLKADRAGPRDRVGGPRPEAPTREARVHTGAPAQRTCVWGGPTDKGVCTRPPVGAPRHERPPVAGAPGVRGDRREATRRGPAHLGPGYRSPNAGGGERRRNPRGQPPSRGDVIITKLSLCHAMSYSDPGRRTGWDSHVLGGRPGHSEAAADLGARTQVTPTDLYSDGSRAPSRYPHPVPFSLTSARLSCYCRRPPKGAPQSSLPFPDREAAPPEGQGWLYLSQGAWATSCSLHAPLSDVGLEWAETPGQKLGRGRRWSCLGGLNTPAGP